MRTPPKSVFDIVRELWVLLKAYGRQETIEPLRNLGRYLGFGLAGSALMGLGLVFLSLSALRALQETTTIFEGFWSWVPYLAILIVLCGIIWFALKQITKESKSSGGEKTA